MSEAALPIENKNRAGRLEPETRSANWQHRTLRPGDPADDFARLEPDTAMDKAARLPTVYVRVEQTPREFVSLYASLERQLSLGEAESLVGDRPAGEAPYVLGVTSAVPGEGKTTTALHLALTIGRNTFKKVCLVDLSLGRGDLGSRLGISPGERGLTGVLEEDINSVVPTLQLAECDNLVIIPAGGAPKNPSRMARSPRVAQLIASARCTFDVVIVDLPAASSENILPLARHVDGLLVVTRAGVTPRSVVSQAVETLGRDRVVGVTLNRYESSCPNWLQKRFSRVSKG